MKNLNDKDLIKVEGGSISAGLLTGILAGVTAGVTFIIGVIDGIVRPLKCNY